jgi:hypothetical protein
MLPPFDIFRVDADEIPRWVESAETVDDAKARAKEILKSHPAEEIVIFSQTTHKRVSIKSDASTI